MSRVDPVAYGVVPLAVVVSVAHGFDGALQYDHAVYGYAGQQVLNGQPPYVGILNRAGPLAHLLPALGVAAARVGGFEDLLGMRLLSMATSVACAWLIYLLGRELFASRLAGWASAAAFLSTSAFFDYAANGPGDRTWMVFFLSCALLAGVRRQWFAAGVGVSLATLCWQPAFVVGLTAIIGSVLAAAPPGERLRALVRVAAGGLVPAAICIGCFAAVGAFRDLLDGFLLLNAEYTAASPVTTNPGRKWSRLQQGFGPSLWVVLAGLTALLHALLTLLRRENRHDRARRLMAALGLAVLAGVGWSLRDFDGRPDAFVLLPVAAIGVGGIARAIRTRWTSRRAVCVTVAWVTAAMVMALHSATTQEDPGLARQRASVDAVLARLPSDATMLSVQAPQALVLSGSTNPTRHQTLSAGLDRYVEDTWPGGLTGFGHWVAHTEPTVVVTRHPEAWERMSAPIEAEYQRVGKAPGWTWYVHRSVGTGTISDLREALARLSRASR